MNAKEKTKEEKPVWKGGKPPEYYKHPQYGHVYGPTTASPQGRLAWTMHLSKPKEGMEQADGSKGAPRYEVTLLLDKTDPRVKVFIETMKTITDYLIGIYNIGKKAKLDASFDLADGDVSDTEKYPFNKGMWILVARNAKQPKFFDEDKTEQDVKNVVGGLVGKLLIQPLITAHGVSFRLEAVQTLKDDGTRFAGGGRDLTALLDDATSEGAENTEETSEPSASNGKALAVNLL